VLVTASFAEVMDRVLGDRTDVIAALARAGEDAWVATDPDLLELCRQRIATLLGAPDAGPPPVLADLDERERAVLAYCEQFVIDVASMTEARRDAVAGHLGPQGLADLTTALLAVEQRQRMHLMWDRLGLIGDPS
jgi:hypothetical protein